MLNPLYHLPLASQFKLIIKLISEILLGFGWKPGKYIGAAVVYHAYGGMEFRLKIMHNRALCLNTTIER